MSSRPKRYLAVAADGRKLAGPSTLERFRPWAEYQQLTPLKDEWIEVFFCSSCQELRSWLVRREANGQLGVHPLPASIKQQLRSTRQPL